MAKVKESPDFTGKTIYAGLDVHEANFNVSLYCDHQYLRSFQQPPDPDKLVNLLHRDYPGAKYICAYEAGFCGFWIQRQLEVKGINCLVVHAADIPFSGKRNTNKTDRNDSKGIGAALQAGMLNSIYIPSEKTESDRQIIRYRQQIKKDHTRMCNRIKSLLYKTGIVIPDSFKNGRWSKAFIQWLKQVDIDQKYVRYSLSRLIEQQENLNKELLLVNKELRLVLGDEVYKRNADLLKGIPGIGPITAATLLVEIGNIKRFSSFNQFNSFIGFYPSEFSSGKSEHHGHIQPRHNRELRSLLVEAAWIAARHDPALTLSFQELKKRMTGKRAIIRIARKLTNRIWHVWTKQVVYEKGVVA